MRTLSADLLDLHHRKAFFVIANLVAVDVKVVVEYFQLKLRVVRAVLVCALQS